MKKSLSVFFIMLTVFLSGCSDASPTPSVSFFPTPTLSLPTPSVTAETVTDLPTITPSSVPVIAPTSAPTSVPTARPTQQVNTNLRPIEKDGTVTLSDKYGYYELMSDVEMLTEKYPSYLTRSSLGTTEFGREIPILVMGNKNSEKRILIVASSHAREYANSAIIMKTVETYCKEMSTRSYSGISYETLLSSVSIWIVPMHNPDGVEISLNGLASVPEEYKQTVQDICSRSVKKKFLSSGSYTKWKANGLGYDLNRDYGIGKKSATQESRPMSENYGGDFYSKEGKLIADFIRNGDFASVTSYHSCGQIIYWGFYATGEFKEKCREMANAMKSLNGYRLVEDTQKSEYDYAYLGLKDWFMKDYKKPGFTIETGSGSAPLSLSDIKTAVNKNLEIPALLAWYAYTER